MTSGAFSGTSASLSGEFAILAGGCFWCTEAVFAPLRGVLAVEPGYIGGELSDTANYEAVCSGQTGHAEAVRVRFDPVLLTYRDLLEVFFATHDPTQLNRQGNDVGSQYRSAIFWLDEAQRTTAQALLDALQQADAYSAPIVTEVVAAGEFFPAEAYHHDYYRRNPQQGYCVFVIAPKLGKLRAKFANLLKNDA
ncbi:peptide-methionine (S)-S-oxide reductase MsrA [Uliginosibacterium sp. 31-12]|uniref:peptide-methionine (S)-S-oxide reductase MsrA n=1 Tax=Uliginosibacterium sp. 31-12 TaxID=3062781 RepID=UPI0026E30183|nr:peptide-methionine (S)-S-oxide reductase MsrA [Uliginosibacterium sp. 31-12]MDO6387588.1 peptide-methionine (S)-S-oxide reductase MsrA [Uliginosibacterium sp. 31-12]